VCFLRDSDASTGSGLCSCRYGMLDWRALQCCQSASVAASGRWEETAHGGVCRILKARRSVGAANAPVWFGKDCVRLVDVDVPPELTHLQIVFSVAEAAQAVARSHADSWLVARLVLGRRLAVA
jgi:hypothetical protein